jgi:hypothetical protein
MSWYSGYQHLRGICWLHFQGRRVNQIRKGDTICMGGRIGTGAGRGDSVFDLLVSLYLTTGILHCSSVIFIFIAGRPQISLLNIIIVIIAVGDTVYSYAYDGNRVRKWNVSTHKYGEAWLSGDIIGCTIDLDSGVIEFYRQVYLYNLCRDFLSSTDSITGRLKTANNKVS